jgi:iron complex outermembrane receptor protein
MTRIHILLSALLVTCGFIFSGMLHAQAARPLTWLDDLTLLRDPSSLSLQEQQDSVMTIRHQVEDWLKAHPDSAITLPAAPALPWSAAQSTEQVSVLREAVENIIRENPDRPFHLGAVSVNVTSAASTLGLSTDSISQAEISSQHATTVAKALEFLPGVSIQHIASNRNEAGIMVRGFSSRGQVPLYLDGIPIYVPYDGYVDFNRFLTSDIAEVQVSRGYTSPLLGPNALGGTINLVTKEPTKKLEGDASIGTGSGNELLSALNLGSRWEKFFVQGSVDWLQRDYLPLSGDFKVLQYTKLPDITMTSHQNHSNSRDEKYSGRFGWTPKGNDEYVFSYTNQKGEKGVPLYMGTNTNATFNNFWNWPYWNRNSYYFHSNSGLGEKSSVQFRVFYDQFRNSIDMYSNDTYSVMNTQNAQHSHYDEHTDGGSGTFSTRLLPRNVLSASFFFKDDTHREYGVYPARTPYPLVAPNLVDRAQQTSIGLEDAVRLSSRLHVTMGFSAEHLNGLQAQSYNTAYTKLIPFTCLASPNNTSFDGCTAHVWNYNPLASVSYSLGESGSVFLTFADRSRFPMLKDIYSAGMGSALPNPDLKPEHSRNWNIGYSRLFPARTLVQVELFRSDLRDAIESVYITDPGGTSAATQFCPSSKVVGYCSQNANIGSEVHQGVEVTVRSTPVSRLTLDANYSYQNRTINYDFGNFPNVSRVNTSIQVLQTLPRNKMVANATVRIHRQILGIVSGRYEGGLTLQDTTYANASPLHNVYAESYGTMDLAAVVPIRSGVRLQTGVKNVLDRNYFYTAGYPEVGRNWYFSLHYRF